MERIAPPSDCLATPVSLGMNTLDTFGRKPAELAAQAQKNDTATMLRGLPNRALATEPNRAPATQMQPRLFALVPGARAPGKS
jgi:hypothetical protein